MLEQIVSLLGAALILIAYALVQLNRMTATSRVFLLMNLAGSLILAIVAFRVHQLGLTVVEGSWAGISVYGLLKKK